eukprot:scaffold773_cov114-Isochrysis_galbana.AAC.7
MIAWEPPLQELAPAATSGLWTRSVHDRPRVSESALSEGTPPVGPWRGVVAVIVPDGGLGDVRVTCDIPGALVRFAPGG